MSDFLFFVGMQPVRAIDRGIVLVISDLGMVHAMLRLASLHLIKLRLGDRQLLNCKAGLLEVEICYVQVR